MSSSKRAIVFRLCLFPQRSVRKASGLGTEDDPAVADLIDLPDVGVVEREIDVAHASFAPWFKQAAPLSLRVTVVAVQRLGPPTVDHVAQPIPVGRQPPQSPRQCLAAESQIVLRTSRPLLRNTSRTLSLDLPLQRLDLWLG